MRLSEVQRRFKNKMLEGREALGSDSDLLKSFEENGIAVKDRLGIYQNNILENMGGVLEITYPAIHALVGEDFFRHAAYAYILENPPASGDVNLYGENFPAFLAGLKQTQNLPYLYDVARYERALNKAYYAKDDDALPPQALERVKKENYAHICFTFRASASLLESTYAVDEIKDFALTTKAEDEKTLDVTKPGTPLLIYRPALQVRTEYLEDAGFTMLLKLKNGKAVGEALKQTLEIYPTFDLSRFLEFHLAIGSFAGVHFKKEKNK